MSLSPATRQKISDTVKKAILCKLERYEPKTNYMPFHDRIVGRRNRAAFSLIHSINTILGMAVFEKVAQLVAKETFPVVETQYRQLRGYLSQGAQAEITAIVDALRNKRAAPNKSDESRRVSMKAREGILGEERNQRVDIFLKAHDGTECRGVKSSLDNTSPV